MNDKSTNIKENNNLININNPQINNLNNPFNINSKLNTFNTGNSIIDNPMNILPYSIITNPYFS